LLSGKGNPSFWGRRLQHARFEASTRLTPPATPGTSAGLALIQDETHHYYLGVQRTAAGLQVFVELHHGPQPAARLASRLLPADTPALTLRITGEATTLSFTYADSAGHWTELLRDADSYPITVQAAGGGLHFTGALVGPHARIEP
jgi:alpha-N-arabinofuranosidase